MPPSKPRLILDFITPPEVNELLSLHNTLNPNRIKAYNEERDFHLDNHPLSQKIYNLVPREHVALSHFFKAHHAYWPHVDNGKNPTTIPQKVILIPLETKPKVECQIIFFKQYYLGHASTFYKGCPTSLAYNAVKEDYSQLDDLRSGFPIDESTYKKYLCHLPYSALEGLEIDEIFPWQPGSAIIFDRYQLHASSSFKPNGIQHKIGLNIFTETKANISS